MHTTEDIKKSRIADAWAELQEHANSGASLEPHANRLAFADPEFLLRRETRGIRFQLELLKPDLDQQAMGIEHTIVVFGGARFKDHEKANLQLEQALQSGNAQAIQKAKVLVRNADFYDKARVFAQNVARYSQDKSADQKIYIATGGGPGIMEAANRGAHDLNALSVGLNIALPHEQSANPYVSPELSFKFHYFALRKMHFLMRAKALVAFPGGFGTLDELFEVLTLVQTKKVNPVPIVLFGTEFWKRLIDFDFLVQEGVIAAEDIQLFHFSDDPVEAWEYIRQFYQL